MFPDGALNEADKAALDVISSSYLPWSQRKSGVSSLSSRPIPSKALSQCKETRWGLGLSTKPGCTIILSEPRLQYSIIGWA
jgi:hypothetical protein